MNECLQGYMNLEDLFWEWKHLQGQTTDIQMTFEINLFFWRLDTACYKKVSQVEELSGISWHPLVTPAS